MKNILLSAVMLIALSACKSNGTMTMSSADGQKATVALGGPKAKVSKEAIEACWKRAGLKGDIYKFMTPAEAAGLLPSEAISQTQVDVFKTCLGH